MAAPTEPPPCGQCGAAAAPYTCPRCNRRLCSLGCYRGHGVCAEAFYREQVLQALAAERGVPPPGRGRVRAALGRLRELREAGDPQAALGRGLWERLSRAERAEFGRLVRSGEALGLLPPWRPWWWRRGRPEGLVEELGPGEGEEARKEEREDERVGETAEKEAEKVQKGDEKDKGDHKEDERDVGDEEEAEKEDRMDKKEDKKVQKVDREAKKDDRELKKAKTVDKEDKRDVGDEEEAEKEAKMTKKEDKKVRKVDREAKNAKKEEKKEKGDHKEGKRDVEDKKKAEMAKGDQKDNEEDMEDEEDNGDEDNGGMEVNEEEDDDEGLAGPMPPLPATVPPLRSLRAAPPSPLLRFQLPNVLYGYAFALSLHHGDEALLPEMAAAALASAASLRCHRPFASTAEALHDAQREAEAAGYPQCPLGSAGTVLAVAQLLRGRSRRRPSEDAEAALHHLGRLLGAARQRLRGEEEERGRLGRARKKCLYLLAWSRERGGELAALAEEARQVHAEVAAAEAEVEALRRRLEGSWGGPRPPAARVMVEELP